jgi:hypothetical protein
VPSMSERYGRQLKRERTATMGKDDIEGFASLVGCEPSCLKAFESGVVSPNADLAEEIAIVLYVVSNEPAARAIRRVTGHESKPCLTSFAEAVGFRRWVPWTT